MERAKPQLEALEQKQVTDLRGELRFRGREEGGEFQAAGDLCLQACVGESSGNGATPVLGAVSRFQQLQLGQREEVGPKGAKSVRRRLCGTFPARMRFGGRRN